MTLSQDHGQTVSRKPYRPPAIVYQGRLEAQAGSPLGDALQDVFDDTLTKPRD